MEISPIRTSEEAARFHLSAKRGRNRVSSPCSLS